MPILWFAVLWFALFAPLTEGAKVLWAQQTLLAEVPQAAELRRQRRRGQQISKAL